VIVVFAAGILAPRLAHRWSAIELARVGALVALAGAALLLAGGSTAGLALFTAAISVFLFGMGLINPLGTAMALAPFGRQAGLASALLGCLQMAMAALMSVLGASLPFPPAVSLGLLLGCTATAATMAFLVPSPEVKA
jgi:DHA1 family bicyclomycin/chloramphenicol resistance-like MFS transporter